MTRKRFTTDAPPNDIVGVAFVRAHAMGYSVKKVGDTRLRIEIGSFWVGLFSRGRSEHSLFRLEAKAFDDGNDLMLEWHPTSLFALLRQNARGDALLRDFAAALEQSGFEVTEVEEY